MPRRTDRSQSICIAVATSDRRRERSSRQAREQYQPQRTGSSSADADTPSFVRFRGSLPTAVWLQKAVTSTSVARDRFGSSSDVHGNPPRTLFEPRSGLSRHPKLKLRFAYTRPRHSLKRHGAPSSRTQTTKPAQGRLCCSRSITLHFVREAYLCTWGKNMLPVSLRSSLSDLLVERRRIELPTFALRTRRSPS